MTFAYQSIGSSPAGRRIWEAGVRHSMGLPVKPPSADEIEARRRAKLHRVLRQVEAGRADPLLHLPTVREVATDVAERHGIGLLDIMSHRRSREIIHARHEAFWLARNMTKATYPQIGRALGFDHTTVMHGVRCHEARMRGEKYIHPCRRKA